MLNNVKITHTFSFHESFPKSTFMKNTNYSQAFPKIWPNASIYTFLVMLVLGMSFGLVQAQVVNQDKIPEITETTGSQLEAQEPFKSTRVELLPMRWMMGTGGILEQQKYKEARETVASCQESSSSSQCQNACQLVEKVERVWNAVIQNCKCKDEAIKHPPNHPCKSTCDKAHEIWETANSKAQTQEKLTFCPNILPYETHFSGLVFSTYLFLDMADGMKQISMLTQGINQIMAKTLPHQQATQNAILSMAQDTYLNARSCRNNPLEPRCFSEIEKYCTKYPNLGDPECKTVLSQIKHCQQNPNKPQCNSFSLLVKNVDNVIVTLVCQKDKNVSGCDATPPNLNVDELIQECRQNPKSCQIDLADVFVTYIVWEMVKGFQQVVTGFEHLRNIHAALKVLNALKNMANVMGMMNRNMEMMRHDMGIMRYDLDSTMGRAGRAMPWMPWGQ